MKGKRLAKKNKKAARKWTAPELMKLIRLRFAGDAYVVVDQVAQGTGAHAQSWVDAAVFSLWPSRGLYRSAFEIKCARGDFIRELRQPIKNEWARECFHEFWFVAPSGVIKESEVPEGVGWMRPHGDTLAAVVHAKRKENPRLDNVFLAAVVRAIGRGFERQQTVALGEKLTNDPEVARARAWKEAGEKYLAKMGGGRDISFHYTKDPDEILAAFLGAKHDDRIKQDREQVLRVLDRFQDEMIGFLELAAMIANNGILARNEAGEFIIKTWGGRDEGAISELAKWAKKRGGHYKKRDARKKLGALRALLEFMTIVEPEGDERDEVETETEVQERAEGTPEDGPRSPFGTG